MVAAIGSGGAFARGRHLSLVVCLYSAQLLGHRQRHPVGLDAKLGQDDPRRVVTGQASYVAARMAARSTQVETGQGVHADYVRPNVFQKKITINIAASTTTANTAVGICNSSVSSCIFSCRFRSERSWIWYFIARQHSMARVSSTLGYNPSGPLIFFSGAHAYSRMEICLNCCGVCSCVSNVIRGHENL